MRSLRDEGREIFTDGWREQIGRDSLRGLVYYYGGGGGMSE